MGLRPIVPGLRALWHDSSQPTKVQIVVAPGATVVVPEDVAAQLEAASTHFVPVDDAPDVDEVPVDEVPDAEVPDVDEVVKPKRKPKG